MARRSVTVVDPAEKDRRKAELEKIRRARFERHAERRVRNALKRIDLVKRLANTSAYSYTQDEAIKITGAILRAVELVEDAFSAKNNNKEQFTL